MAIQYPLKYTKVSGAATGLQEFEAGDQITADLVNGLMGRNLLINGNFDFWQRGTAIASTPSLRQYLADRWVESAGSSSIAASRQAFTGSQTTVPGNPRYFHRSVVNSLAGAGNYATLRQLIERATTFAGETATLSFWAKSDAARPMSVELAQRVGSSEDVTGIGATKVNLTTVWQKFAITINVPVFIASTFGSDYLELLFWFDAGSNYNARTASLGQQSGTFDIAQVQIESGAVASAFEQRPYGVELMLCQRYYEVLNGARLHGMSYTPNGDTRGARMDFQVLKRVPPALTQSGSLNVIASGESGSAINVPLGTLSLVSSIQAAHVGAISNYAAFSGCGNVMSWGDNGAGAFTVYADAEL